MSVEVLLGILVFGTLGAACLFGIRSVSATERRRREEPRKSTLATDAPSSTPPGVEPVD